MKKYLLRLEQKLNLSQILFSSKIAICFAPILCILCVISITSCFPVQFDPISLRKQDYIEASSKTSSKRTSSKSKFSGHSITRDITVNSVDFLIVREKPFSKYQTLGHQYLFAVIPFTSLALKRGESSLGSELLAQELNTQGYSVAFTDPESLGVAALIFRPNYVLSMSITNATATAYDALVFRILNVSGDLTLSQYRSSNMSKTPVTKRHFDETQYKKFGTVRSIERLFGLESEKTVAEMLKPFISKIKNHLRAKALRSRFDSRLDRRRARFLNIPLSDASKVAILSVENTSIDDSLKFAVEQYLRKRGLSVVTSDLDTFGLFGRLNKFGLLMDIKSSVARQGLLISTQGAVLNSTALNTAFCPVEDLSDLSAVEKSLDDFFLLLAEQGSSCVFDSFKEGP